MAELKPCPFCGGTAQVYTYVEEQAIYDKHTLGFLDTEERTVYGAGCPECGCIVAEKYSEEQAVEAWNRRANNG